MCVVSCFNDYLVLVYWRFRVEGGSRAGLGWPIGLVWVGLVVLQAGLG